MTNQIERRMKAKRLEEELILKLVVSDADREERLRAAWRKRFAWMESERLTIRMKG